MSEFSGRSTTYHDPVSFRSLRFDEESINNQKNCIPGPNVKFSKKAVPFGEYLYNIENPGSLGCNPDQYPKYTNGKYCCENEMATPQEKFDYVNTLLLNAIENVGETSFKKYSREIDYLQNSRKTLLEQYGNSLEDTLSEEFPLTINNNTYENLDDYISKNMITSIELGRDQQYKYLQGEGLENQNQTKINTASNKNLNSSNGGGKVCKKTVKHKKKKTRRKKTIKKSRKSSRRRNKRLTKQ